MLLPTEAPRKTVILLTVFFTLIMVWVDCAPRYCPDGRRIKSNFTAIHGGRKFALLDEGLSTMAQVSSTATYVKGFSPNRNYYLAPEKGTWK